MVMLNVLSFFFSSLFSASMQVFYENFVIILTIFLRGKKKKVIKLAENTSFQKLHKEKAI